MNDNPDDRVPRIDDLDRTAERLGAALTARSQLVTDETVALPDELPPPEHGLRWPLAAAAGVLVIAIATTIVVLAMTGWGDGAPVSPPVITETTTSPPTTTTETSTPTSTTTSTSSTSTSAPTEQPAGDCSRECVIQTVTVSGEVLELVGIDAAQFYYDSDPISTAGSYVFWQLRVRGAYVIGQGPAVRPGMPFGESEPTQGAVGHAVVTEGTADWPDPLWCDTVASQPVCLLRTTGTEHLFGHFGVLRDGEGWRFTGHGFGTWRYGESIVVRDLGRDGVLEVVAVERDHMLQPGERPWSARVWRFGDGAELGCVPRVSTAEQLPGWPDVTPNPASLAPANCLGP